MPGDDQGPHSRGFIWDNRRHAHSEGKGWLWVAQGSGSAKFQGNNCNVETIEALTKKEKGKMTMKSDNDKKQRAFLKAFAKMPLEEQRDVLALVQRLIRELGVELPADDVDDDGGEPAVDMAVWGPAFED